MPSVVEPGEPEPHTRRTSFAACIAAEEVAGERMAAEEARSLSPQEAVPAPARAVGAAARRMSKPVVVVAPAGAVVEEARNLPSLAAAQAAP
jgi:hypothetical protein